MPPPLPLLQRINADRLPQRDTSSTRDVHAGCHVCGDTVRWFGPNAQGVAARHHDATGHATWCEIALSIAYGRPVADDRQLDLEDAIGAAA